MEEPEVTHIRGRSLIITSGALLISGGGVIESGPPLIGGRRIKTPDRGGS